MSRVAIVSGFAVCAFVAASCGGGRSPATPPSEVAPILHRAIAAMGGLERLEATRTLTSRATVTQGDMSFPVSTAVVLPDAIREVVEWDDARFERVLRKGEGFGVFDGAPYALSEDEAASVKESLRLTEIALLARLVLPGAAVKELPAADGAARLEVRFDDEPEGPFELRFDPESARLRSVRWNATIVGPRGRAAAVLSFDDWRVVDDVPAAFSATMTVEGEAPVTSKLASFAWNAPVDAGAFDPTKGEPPILTRDLGPETVALWERVGEEGPDLGAASEKLAAFVSSRGLIKRRPVFRLLSEKELPSAVGVAVAPPATETRPSSSSADSLRVTTLPAGRVLSVAVAKPDDAKLRAAVARLTEEAGKRGYEAARPPMVVAWSDGMAQVRLPIRPK